MTQTQPMVWISEDVGDEGPDGGLSWTGKVSARLQYPYPDDRSIDGPESVSLDEAISWARQQAPVVLFRSDNQLYYAGSEPFEGAIPWTSEALPPRARLIYEERETWAGPWLVRVKFASGYVYEQVRASLVAAGFGSVHRADAEGLVVLLTVQPKGREAVSVTVDRVVDTIPGREVDGEGFSSFAEINVVGPAR